VIHWHARELAAAGSPPRLGGELFEAAWRLRGVENFMLDLVLGRFPSRSIDIDFD
jgi:hypothetical protein